MSSFETPWVVTFGQSIVARFADKWTALQFVAGSAQPTDSSGWGFYYDATSPAPAPSPVPSAKAATAPVATQQAAVNASAGDTPSA